MKKIFASLIILIAFTTNAQQFINSGMIEYEVRVNNHRMYGDGFYGEMFKDKKPNFSNGIRSHNGSTTNSSRYALIN